MQKPFCKRVAATASCAVAIMRVTFNPREMDHELRAHGLLDAWRIARFRALDQIRIHDIARAINASAAKEMARRCLLDDPIEIFPCAVITAWPCVFNHRPSVSDRSIPEHQKILFGGSFAC